MRKAASNSGQSRSKVSEKIFINIKVLSRDLKFSLAGSREANNGAPVASPKDLVRTKRGYVAGAGI
jgi:hypothetical protein